MNIFSGKPVSRRDLRGMLGFGASAFVPSFLHSSNRASEDKKVQEKFDHPVQEYIYENYGVMIHILEDKYVVGSLEVGQSMFVPHEKEELGSFKAIFYYKILNALRKYPPLSLKEKRYIKHIEVFSKIVTTTQNTKCEYTVNIGGYAYSSSQLLTLSVKDSVKFNETIFDHEMVHLLLSKVSRADWVKAIKLELGKDDEHLLDESKIKDWDTSDREKHTCTYDPKNYEESGNYNEVNFHEDIAVTSEFVFHSGGSHKVPEGDEYIVLLAKQNAFKKLFQKELGLPNDYWEFVKNLALGQADNVDYFIKHNLWKKDQPKF